MMDHETTTQTVKDINTISTFLSNQQLSSLSPPVQTATTCNTPNTITPSTLIIAASAILHQAHTIFTFLQHTTNTNTNDSTLKTLLLTGGIGHSTLHLYTAISRSPLYSTLPTIIGRTDNNLNGLAEARLFYLIFLHFHDGERVMREWNGGAGLTVLVEEQSTNCGANAALSRDMLMERGVMLGDGEDDDVVVIMQDPTMSLRTKASFEKVYHEEVAGGRVRFWCWPTFVPWVMVAGEGEEGKEGKGEIVWDDGAVGMEGVDVRGLWGMKRFYGLILGEVARLRDDENGYGPVGKGFVAHVDVSDEVESAWNRLNRNLEVQR